MAEDYLTNFQDLISKWDKAQEEGVFANAKTPFNPNPSAVEEYGAVCNSDGSPSEAMKAVMSNSENMSDGDYWRAVAGLARGDDVDNAANVNEPLNLTEAGSINTPNPVDASSLGQDTSLVATPDFTEGPLLQKLDQLKRDLHALGDQLAGSGSKWSEDPVDSTDKGGQSVMRKIHALQKQIDEISNALTPSSIEQEKGS